MNPLTHFLGISRRSISQSPLAEESTYVMMKRVFGIRNHQESPSTLDTVC